MAYAKGTIRLDAARNIFGGVSFTEIMIGDKTVGYIAVDESTSRELARHTGLTALCKTLWSTAKND